METVIIYESNAQQQSQGHLLIFTPFMNDSLPFPLNLTFKWRLLISAVLVAIFARGVHLRMKIISYIRCPETKMNETNILFCLDQADGLFLAINLACGIIFTMMTLPISSLVDLNVCYLNGVSQGLYFSGTFVWRFWIAILRALYIKANLWLIRKIGVRNLLVVMVLIGQVFMLSFCFLAITSDKYSYSKRICYRWSDEALDIIRSYQVKIFNHSKTS